MSDHQEQGGGDNFDRRVAGRGNVWADARKTGKGAAKGADAGPARTGTTHRDSLLVRG